MWKPFPFGTSGRYKSGRTSLWVERVWVGSTPCDGNQFTRLEKPTIEAMDHEHPLWQSTQYAIPMHRHLCTRLERTVRTVLYIHTEKKWTDAHHARRVQYMSVVNPGFVSHPTVSSNVVPTTNTEKTNSAISFQLAEKFIKSNSGTGE